MTTQKVVKNTTGCTPGTLFFKLFYTPGTLWDALNKGGLTNVITPLSCFPTLIINNQTWRMPRSVIIKKKRAPKKKSNAKRYGQGRSSSAMTTYVPFFRKMYAARNFTKLQMGIQGFLDSSTAASTGYFTVDSSYLTLPFASGFSFIGPANGVAFLSGGTNTIFNYNGYNVLATQYEYWRIHRRRLKIQCLPTIQGDQVMISTFPTNVTGPLAPTSSVAAAQSYGKTRMVGYASEPGTLYQSQSAQEILGLTKIQWEAQPPTAIGSVPDPTLRFYDVIQWSTVDGGRLGANLVWNVTLEVDVEYSSPKQQIN